MAQIKTLEQMRDYIKLMLGFPVMQVEVDDSQIDQNVEDSIEFFQKYNTGEGSYLSYLVFNLSAGQSEYSLSGYEGCFDISLSIGIDGINTLFSPSHELLYSDFVRKGSIFGAENPDYSPGLILTSWDSAMQYLQEVKNKFGRMYTISYNANRDSFMVTPTPNDNMTGVLYLYKKEDAVNIYNHPLIKKLALGKCMLQLARHSGKYNVTLPDGITINYADVRAEGQKFVDDAEAAIIGESQPIDFFLA